MYYYVQVASLAQLLPPRSPTVSNPAADSSLCRAAAPRLRPFAPRMRPLQLPSASNQLLLPGPIASASTASASSCCSPILRPLQHARRLRPLHLLLPIASASVAAPRLRPLQVLLLDSSPMFSSILCGVQDSVNKLKYEGRASL